MMFDNTPPSSPSRWSTAKRHLPVVMLVVGFAGLFIGLHAAATTLVVVAAVHLAGAAGVFGFQYLRRGRSGSTA